MFESFGDSVSELVSIRKTLGQLPTLRLELPTAVLVGSPNVGKSTIVRTISSGTPEVKTTTTPTRLSRRAASSSRRP